MSDKREVDELVDLFVYGTLRRGQPLEPWLDECTLTVRAGYIKGTLYPVYSGAYPVAFLDQPGLIYGEVRTCQMTDTFLQCVLMERGAGYIPMQVDVVNSFGDPTGKKCVAFHYRQRNPGTARIMSGDWVQFIEEYNRTPTQCPHCSRIKTHTCLVHGEPYRFTQPI